MSRVDPAVLAAQFGLEPDSTVQEQLDALLELVARLIRRDEQIRTGLNIASVAVNHMAGV